MAFRHGDVVLVPFPFSNLSTTKARPAVETVGEETSRGEGTSAVTLF
jgi:hypothetical protein